MGMIDVQKYKSNANKGKMKKVRREDHYFRK